MKKTVGIIVLILAVGAGVFFCIPKKKFAYVNTYQVYGQFNLKKELEDKLKKTQLARQVLLDSIKSKIQLTAINKTLDQVTLAQRIEEMKESYFIKEKQFSRENETQAQQYTDQVWEQLNQYVKDYGKEHHYQYIFGANGQGGIMYADDTEDISKDIIDYVNNKYQGAH